MMPGEVAAKRAAEREQMRSIIQQWNSDRLDLFELSEPNEVRIIYCPLLLLLFLVHFQVSHGWIMSRLSGLARASGCC